MAHWQVYVRAPLVGAEMREEWKKYQMSVLFMALFHCRCGS